MLKMIITLFIIIQLNQSLQLRFAPALCNADKNMTNRYKKIKLSL